MIFQTPEATAAALRATQSAKDRFRATRVRRPLAQAEVDVAKLLPLLRVMANRFERDGYRGTLEQWRRLSGLLIEP